jgi:hypothetical protein
MPQIPGAPQLPQVAPPQLPQAALPPAPALGAPPPTPPINPSVPPPAAPAAKSMLPLLIGLNVVAIIAIAIVLYFVMRK